MHLSEKLPDSTQEFWNELYHLGDTGWDLGDASVPIVEYFNQTKQSHLKILIPGSGNGHEARHLRSQGFTDVHVLDFSSKAIENFKIQSPNFPRSHIHRLNFFSHKGGYDRIVEQTFFCAIHPSLRASYAKQMYDLLLPGGKLVGLLFDVPKNKDKPPYGGTQKEYYSIFSPWFHIKTLERCYNSVPDRRNKEIFIILEKRN